MQLIALQEGEALPKGYAYLICGTANVGPTVTHPVQRLNDTLDVSPPPKAILQSPKDLPDTLKTRLKTRRNLTRNINKKTQASFACEGNEGFIS